MTPRLPLLALALSLPLAALRAEPPAYRNPVLRGDYPDPSIVRVGDEFFATATSSEWAPHFPLLRSRDLVNWDVIGAVFEKAPAWADANFWAPELQEWKGKFYLYYVARKKGGPLAVAVATAEKPQGPWTDHGPLVAQEAGSIDGMAVDDEQGQRWLVWKEDGNSRGKPTPIWAQRLDAAGTRLTGEMHELLRNDAPWEGALVEGPFILRRGDWFYLLFAGNACCGRGCNYGAGVARSRSLLGPWEKNPRNPILATTERFRGPGHGSVVADAKGRLFFLYHAYSLPSFVETGREMMLDELTLGEDGWPVIGGGKAPSISAPSPLGATQTRAELAFFDDFTAANLQPGWQWPVGNQPAARLESGTLILAPGAAHAARPLGAVHARSCTSGEYAATTVIDAATLAPGVLAGISAFGDGDHALGLAIARDGKATLWEKRKGQRRDVASIDCATAAPVHLRMTALDGLRFRFSVSPDGREWRDVGEPLDGDALPPWDRAVRIALTAGGAAGAEARFGFLRVEPAAAR